jgi:YesN/AraC family two-component response regulator
MDNKIKVLCVDDEQINLLILKRILGKTYEILTADEGKKALEILENDPSIKLVISDMRMPVMNGLEIIKEANHRFSKVKYFMLSGYAITDEIQNAINSKLITKYFEKPADFDTIIKTLQEHS